MHYNVVCNNRIGKYVLNLVLGIYRYSCSKLVAECRDIEMHGVQKIIGRKFHKVIKLSIHRPQRLPERHF